MQIIERLKDIIADTDKNELVSKAFSFLIFSFSGMFAGYLFTWFIARQFGASVNGLIALSFSVFMIVSILGRMGVHMNLVKFYSSDDNFEKDPGIFYKMLLKALIVSCGLGLLVYLFNGLIAKEILEKPQLKPYLNWIALTIPPWVTVILCASVFRARRKNKRFAFLKNSGRFLFSLIFLLIFWLFSSSSLIAIKAHFFGVLTLAILSLILVIKNFKKISLRSKMNSWEFLRESFPMMISSTILVLLGWIDTFILGVFESDDTVGVYNVSLKIATVTLFSLQGINSILAPKIAASYKTGKMKDFKSLIAFSTKLNFFFTLLLAAIIIVFHDFILSIFGPEFKTGYVILIVLCLGQVVNSISGSVGIILQMTGHQKFYRNIVALALGINLILNFTLAPFFGAVGVAIATVVSLASWNIYGAYYLKKKLGVISYYNFK